MKLTPSQMDYLQIGKKEKKIIKSDIKQSRFYYVQMKRNIKKQRKSFKQTNTTFLTTLPTCTITKFGHKATLLYVGTKYFFYVFFIGMYVNTFPVPWPSLAFYPRFCHEGQRWLVVCSG